MLCRAGQVEGVGDTEATMGIEVGIGDARTTIVRDLLTSGKSLKPKNSWRMEFLHG